MIEIIETLPVRIACKNGTELDAIEHRRELNWKRGEARQIKRGMNRRGRRQTRQALRSARS
jgi:hypothetical protein